MGDSLKSAMPATPDGTERSVRDVFERAASGFVEVVSSLHDPDWARPALGAWDVRALVGHTSRALLTVEAYLAKGGGAPQLTDPIGYFLAVLPDPSDPEQRARQDAAIAQRGQQSGAELGEDPAGAVIQLAERVLDLVHASAADAPVDTPAGTMTLSSYLPTRSFELTVHTLDLARAVDLPTPAVLAPAVSAACELAGRLAARRSNAADILLGVLGREIPPESRSAL